MVAKFFDEAKWRASIVSHDWYIKLYSDLQALRDQWDKADGARSNAIKNEVRVFFERALLNGSLALAKTGPNLDAERKPIDTIVIHHTSANPGYRLSYMNAVQLLNVYVPYFSNPSGSIPGEARLRGRPLWSNHVRDGRPVFYLYHWLMRMDGTFECLLKDAELGWHAANWDINCRSIAICLDNDYENQDPSPEVLQRLSAFIIDRYSHVASERIFGHGEVSQHPTICPGTNFVSGWKRDLLRLVTG